MRTKFTVTGVRVMVRVLCGNRGTQVGDRVKAAVRVSDGARYRISSGAIAWR